MMAKKQPRIKANPSGKKIPKTASDPDSYLMMHPSWRFSQCDMIHKKWKIGADELDSDIFSKLRNFETMRWDEILKSNGGRAKGNNHHFIKTEELNKNAQKRLEEMNIHIDEVFSLRLTGTLRLFGLLEKGVFKILWRDNHHEICLSHKKNS